MQTKFVFLASLLLVAACASQPSSRMNASRGPASTDTQGGELISKPEGEHMDPHENDVYAEDQSQMRGILVHQAEPCDAAAATAAMMKNAENTFHSKHRWGQGLKNAFKNCAAIRDLHHGGAAGLHALVRAGVECKLSNDPYSSPPNSLVFSDNFIEAHYKTADKECFVAGDFMQPNCKSITENPHSHRKMYGWCKL